MALNLEEVELAKGDEDRARALVRRGPAELGRPQRELDVAYQGLWFRLARLPWRSLVVVPGDEGGTSAFVATSLADVGRRLRTVPVTFLVMPGPLDYASAGKVVATVSQREDDAEDRGGPGGRVIVSIPPIVSEPLGIAITEAADAVLLCVEKGRTRTAAARKTMDLVGSSRVVGCVLV